MTSRRPIPDDDLELVWLEVEPDLIAAYDRRDLDAALVLIAEGSSS